MTEHASAENLLARMPWMEKIRLGAALGLAALTLIARFGLGLFLAWKLLLILAGVVILCNIVFGLLRKLYQRLPPEELVFERLERFVNAKMCLDLVMLTLVLHFSGGVENPFLLLFLVHPIMAAILLRPRSAYMHAALATALLLALGVGEALRPELHRHVYGYLDVELFGNPYVIAGEVSAIAVAAHVSVYLASGIAGTLHQRERELRAAHDALAASSKETETVNEELRALDERKSRFLGIAAHELRGPLAAAEGCLAVACDPIAADPARQAEALARARARIKGMLEIVRDLLALAGTHKLSESAIATPVAFDELAQRIAEQYADAAAQRQIDLVFHPAAGRLEVLGDERSLADALGNLVSNAVKYANEGGHVKIALRASQTEAVCEVIDDGIGVPEAEIDRLFTEFYRASNARTSGREGTGLGLSLVKEIVERHGGRVKVESLKNLGTCVTIVLPLSSA